MIESSDDAKANKRNKPKERKKEEKQDNQKFDKKILKWCIFSADCRHLFVFFSSFFGCYLPCFFFKLQMGLQGIETKDKSDAII